MKKYIVILLIAVVSFILYGLVGSAIAYVRMAQARVTDSCNLKQLGMSIYSYAGDHHDYLPQGSHPHPATPLNQRLSWVVELLPYIEQRPLYEKFELTEPWDSPTNLAAAQTNLPTFICPASRRAEMAPACTGLPSSLTSSYWTSYVGVTGVGPNAAHLPKGDPRCGAFGYERRVHLRDFRRGTSQTILVMETSDQNGPWACASLSTLRSVDPDIDPQVGPDAPFGRSHRPGWWLFRSSVHDDIRAEVLMGDGSTRTILPTMSAQTLAAAAALAGNGELGDDW